MLQSVFWVKLFKCPNGLKLATYAQLPSPGSLFPGLSLVVLFLYKLICLTENNVQKREEKNTIFIKLSLFFHLEKYFKWIFLNSCNQKY